MKWRDPNSEKPNDGDYILIREYYKSPRHGQFKINYSVMVYLDEFGFEAEYRANKHLYKYKITHWMKIIDPIKLLKVSKTRITKHGKEF